MVGGTVDRRVRDLRHQFGQRARMVFFGMVNDDVVDIREVDLPRNAQTTAKLMITASISNILLHE